MLEDAQGLNWKYESMSVASFFVTIIIGDIVAPVMPPGPKC